MTQLRHLPISMLKQRFDLNVMVETGTEGGDGVVTGLSCGFDEVLSCEIDIVEREV